MAVFVHASVNRSHPCKIRHSCLYLCLTPCRYLPLCCRHVVIGTFGMLLPSFSGSFPLGRAITASLTLMMLSLVVPRLATSLVLVWCSILLGILLLMYCWWWIVFCLHVTIRMLLYCRTLCECSLTTVFRHLNFLNEASHSYFFRRKVSASRILQVPGVLFPEFFQKLFAVCTHPIKTFHCRWWNNSVIPCLTYFPC